jgi:geranylgeranyl reductase family protein
MHRSNRFAIVGGGPAGAFAAAELAGSGLEVLLFDEKLAWEKPCGGGITDKALQRWPFLREAEIERNWISHCELIAPSGRRITFDLNRPIAIFSRLMLNALLLERAQAAGAEVIRDRIVNIVRADRGWKLESSSGHFNADFVVLAAGARNSIRERLSGRLGPENFMVAVGYYIPGSHHTVQIKFLKGLHGYIWIFPRADHFSAGICGRMNGRSTAELRRILEAALPDFGLSLEGARLYAHIIPSLTVAALRTPYYGDGWAMIGDAAGFVDAITGEGLYYALRSADLLASALLQNAPESYPFRVKADFLPELEHAARIANRFYSGNWMGGPVTERMVRFSASSGRFRELMRDLFAGTQEYCNLRQRVYGALPRIAAETLVSTLWSSTGAGNPINNSSASSV